MTTNQEGHFKMTDFWPRYGDPTCGPHRGPQGPCEDIGQCADCGSVSFAMRPAGEVFGDHLPDCSLPERHESYCVGGGDGHGEPSVRRG